MEAEVEECLAWARQAFDGACAAGAVTSVGRQLAAEVERRYPGVGWHYDKPVLTDWLASRSEAAAALLELCHADNFFPEFLHMPAETPAATRTAMEWLASVISCTSLAAGPYLAFALNASVWEPFSLCFVSGLIGMPSTGDRPGLSTTLYPEVAARALARELVNLSALYSGPGGKVLFIHCNELQRSHEVLNAVYRAVNGQPEGFAKAIEASVGYKGELTAAKLDYLIVKAKAQRWTRKQVIDAIHRAGLSKNEVAAEQMFKDYYRKMKAERNLHDWDEW